MERNRKVYYGMGFLFLLIIELLIALLVTDKFIRPYLGDFLVVILLYCLLMAVSNITIVRGLLAVLLFSFAVELIQLIDIWKILKYEPTKLIRILLGSSFSLWDVIAYSLGILTCLFIEYLRNRFMARPHNPVGT